MRSLAPLVLLAIACGGGQSSSQIDSGADNGIDASEPAIDAPVGGITDFTQPGPFSVDQSEDSVTVNGCALAHTLFTPVGGANAPLVVLGHGFSRSRAQMVGIAEHIASYGVRVVTPEYCHLSALDTDHPQNGRDAAALSQSLAGGADVIHAGYSAGGLAAVLAASEDVATVALLGLDLVDADDLGVNVSGSLSIPAFGVAGEPSMCNSDNNGVSVYSGGQMRVVRIIGATHCDFEEPTNGLCTSFCGADSGHVGIAKALGAAFIAWQLGLDASGEAWVTPGGSELSRLVADGFIELL